MLSLLTRKFYWPTSQATVFVISLFLMSWVGGTTVTSAVFSPFDPLASIPICAAARIDAGAVVPISARTKSSGTIALSGGVFEFSIPSDGKSLAGSTHELAFAPDGSAWVTQQIQARLVQITSSREIKFHNLPAGSGPHGIGFDAAGRLWITMEFANEIAEIGPDGSILARHSIHLAGAGPHGLAVAPDGRVWWTGKDGGVVGYLNPRSGQMKVFPLDDPHAKPIYISPGPDGNMWFTELESASIGRITPDGKITSFRLPDPSSRPIAVFPGPNGKLWFTEEAGNAYGSITTTGTITEHPTGIVNGKLAAGAFDRDGDLWIQFYQPDIIQRIAGDGMITTYSLATPGAGQHRIHLGPEGRMWFTELAANKVGYVVVN